MRKPSWSCVSGFALSGALGWAGCFGLGNDDGGPADEDEPRAEDFYGDSGPDTAADAAEYEALREELDDNRRELLETAMEYHAAGKRLYWLEFRAFAPTVHSFDVTTNEAIDYAFSIGGDAYNFDASEDLVVTAIPGGAGTVFEAYDAEVPAGMLDVLEVPGPSDGQRWWAYDVDGFDVYYVTTGESTDLWQWTPGSDPDYVLTLEDTGAEVGTFFGFSIHGDRMMFVESGRAWTLDLTTNESTFLGHETEVQGVVSFDEAGAFIETATGPFYYELATGELTDIAGQIELAGYAINESFARAHHYQVQGVLHDGVIDYIGNQGLFRLNLATSEIEPMLLEPLLLEPDAGVRIEYRQPQVTSDGSVFVVGLIGADAPLFVVR